MSVHNVLLTEITWELGLFTRLTLQIKQISCSIVVVFVYYYHKRCVLDIEEIGNICDFKSKDIKFLKTKSNQTFNETHDLSALY